MAIDLDKWLDARESRRLKAEDRMLARLEKREAVAETQIGELNCGEYYVYPVGGKYKQSKSRAELINYLIRNNYA